MRHGVDIGHRHSQVGHRGKGQVASAGWQATGCPLLIKYTVPLIALGCRLLIKYTVPLIDSVAGY